MGTCEQSQDPEWLDIRFFSARHGDAASDWAVLVRTQPGCAEEALSQPQSCSE